MGKMSLTSCRALSIPGKFSNVDRYATASGKNSTSDASSMVGIADICLSSGSQQFVNSDATEDKTETLKVFEF